MATFAQWRAAVDRGELRRITYVFGEQRPLVEEVVRHTRDRLQPHGWDYFQIQLTDRGAQGPVWDLCNQYPMVPGSSRLVVIRDCEKLTDWTRFTRWVANLRQLPGVYLVFVSSLHELPKQPPAYLNEFKAPRGFLVRCATPNSEDAIAWCRRRGPLSKEMADYLLTRTGGNLHQAGAVCDKLALFGVPAGKDGIDALVAEFPTATFVEHLLTGDKPGALLCLPGLTPSEQLRAVAVLDRRLDLLAQLHRHVRDHGNFRDLQGLPPYLVRQFLPVAGRYDEPTRAYRRRLLAVIDDALRSGARNGALETLTALW